MVLSIIICLLANGLFVHYIVLMILDGNPNSFYSPTHFALGIIGLIVGIASLGWGIGSIRVDRKAKNIISLVLSSIALALFLVLLSMDYIHRLGFRLI